MGRIVMISKIFIEFDEEGLDLLETYEVSTAPDSIASREELEQFHEYTRAKIGRAHV